MIIGWYYLHENKNLIYKNYSDAICDIRESDLCHSAWAWDGKRTTAWQILVESLSLGANKNRINELSELWNCNDEDAKKYAEYLGIEIGEDGSAKYAKQKNFINLQESKCGFGNTFLEALADLCKQFDFKGGKIWNVTFEQLLNL